MKNNIKCKNCPYFVPKFKGMSVLFHLSHIRGWCTDYSNPTFNEFAKTHYGRGLPWKAYLFTGAKGCKFKSK